MPRHILSKQIKIFVSEDDGTTFYQAACAENGTFSQSTTFAEARCQEDDGAVTKAPAEKNTSVTFDGVVVYDQPVGQTPLFELANTDTVIKIKWSTGQTGDPSYTADGFFGNYEETKSAGDFARYSIEFANSTPVIIGVEP